MLERIRSDIRSEDTETMLVLGLSLSTTGTLAVSGASDVGLGTVLGTVTAVFGLVVLAGTVAWGTDGRDTHRQQMG
jgi:hypothetical protein